MNTFTLRRGKERPIACSVAYNGLCVYTVAKEEFTVDGLLTFLGKHATWLYNNDVIVPADYNYTSVTVKDWDILPQALIMPVYVEDTETRRYMYRLDANSDIISSVVSHFNNQAGMPEDSGLHVDEIQIDDRLIFSDLTKIVETIRRNTYPFRRVCAHLLTESGVIRNVVNYTLPSINRDNTGDVISERIIGSLRSRWDVKFGLDQMSTVTEVKLLSDIVDVDGIFVAAPTNCTSMSWKIHCFIAGGYVTTYYYRVEVYELTRADKIVY